MKAKRSILFLLCSALLLPAAGTAPLYARELKFHGPFIQWHGDPTSEATIAWVERLATNVETPPVWREGKAGFGYGDEDDVTAIPEMKGEFTRVYLSTRFSVPASDRSKPLTLSVDYDDAFVAYLNGVEIARSSNLKKQNRDARVTRGHEAGETEIFRIANASQILKAENNILAIEGHNVRKSSSDFTLIPSLRSGQKTLIGPETTWRYLAGADPAENWAASLPKLSNLREFARAESSEWSLLIGPRGSRPSREIKIDEKPFGETDDKVFFGKVSGLRPGTSYSYHLYSGADNVKEGWFRTAPANGSQPIRFIVGGDMGTSTAVPVCNVAASLDPMFGLLGGDLAYANGRDAYKWYDWIDNWTDLVVGKNGRSIPMIAGIGNHEMKGLRVREKDAPYYFSLFDLPNGESNFTVDFGEYLSIILLDSNHAKKVESQTLWLGLQLAAREERKHLFTVYHRPAWGTGIKRNLGDIRRHWTPLFEKHGVDCVFENDHHVYKRSHKITDGKRDDENGILHIGDGAWGAKLRPITPAMLARVGADEYLAEWASVHHLVEVTAFPDGSKAYRALNGEGNVFDEYRDNNPARPKEGLLQ